MFPRVPDQHKKDKRLVPNGLGAIYVLVSAVYLLLMFFFQTLNHQVNIESVLPPLILAVCILFGGFLGLLDDWLDLKWRYKAFLPLIAAIPLASFAYLVPLRPSIGLPIIGTIDFGAYYYFIVVPVIVTIITNTVNQLGGLNGLETICPAVVLIGLMAISGPLAILLYVPLAVWLALAYFNFRGKIFVGNTGSFAIGTSLAAFAIISDLKANLIVSVLPYIFNSSLILLTYFIFRTRASVAFDGEKLCSDHRRSLITIITYNRRLTERQVVVIISVLVGASTGLALLFQRFWP